MSWILVAWLYLVGVLYVWADLDDIGVEGWRFYTAVLLWPLFVMAMTAVVAATIARKRANGDPQ